MDVETLKGCGAVPDDARIRDSHKRGRKLTDKGWKAYEKVIRS